MEEEYLVVMIVTVVEDAGKQLVSIQAAREAECSWRNIFLMMQRAFLRLSYPQT